MQVRALLGGNRKGALGLVTRGEVSPGDALLLGAWLGQEGVVRAALGAGAEMEGAEPLEGWTPLMAAARWEMSLFIDHRTSLMVFDNKPQSS